MHGHGIMHLDQVRQHLACLGLGNVSRYSKG